MFEWVIVYAVPTADSLIYGLLYAWFCGRFGTCRWKHRRIAALCLTLLWILAEEAVLLCGQYGFVTGICLKVLGVLLRFTLAWLFYRLGADKLLFVSFVFSSAWAVGQFLARQLLGTFNGVSVSLTLSNWLRLSGPAFFFLNKLLLVVGLLLSDLLCALLVWLYCGLICAALKDKDRRFGRAELCFLLLPPVAAWLEHWALHILMYDTLPTSPQGGAGEHPGVRAITILVMVLLAMSVLNIVAYQQLVDALRERAERAILERQNADMRRHLDEVAGLNESIRRVRHDMKNHIAVLSRLSADVEGHEELRQYLAGLGSSVGETDPCFSTGSVVVDALLGGKEEEARERLGQKFSLVADGLLFPEELAIQEYDVAVLLGNALDNAIEACAKSEGEPFIELSSEKRGNMLLLEVRNRFTGALRRKAGAEFPLTDKKEPGEHGIGFSSMKAAAEKYHGAIDWRVENETFLLTVMLQDTKPER